MPSNLMPKGVGNRGRESFSGENVTFDEYIQDINGSVAFAATKFAVQPGIAGTFPKGSLKSALYSEWKMVDCEFYFKPEVSQYAAQGQTGKVILAMDYNAGNPAPTTKQQVEIMHVADAMPFEIIRLRLDASCVNKSDSKYIRTGPIPVDEDIKTFDGGNLWVCTIGQGGAGLCGELHARYNFRCTKPTLLNPAQGGLISNVTVAQFQSSAAEASGASTVAANLLVATAVTNGVAVVNTAGSFVPKAGNYLVDVDLYLANDTGDSVTTLDIQKNAVTLYAAAGTLPINGSPNAASAGGKYRSELHASQFVSCSGTDAITFPVTNTYPAGTQTQWGSVRFTAV